MAEPTKANGATTSASGTAAETPNAASEHKNGAEMADKSTDDQGSDDAMFPVTIILPHGNTKLTIPVSPQEQVHEVRQSIIELPEALQYSCFHLEFNGERVNDFTQLSDIKGLGEESELRLVEAPYTEKEARIHFVRVRELIGAAGDRTDVAHGLLSGASVFDDVVASCADFKPDGEFDFAAPPSLCTLLPRETDPAPKTVKAISLSAWNPPPAYWRQKGHLLYLIVTTNEGEQHQITAHVGGFFVNKSSNTKFDPAPRPPPKDHAAHSLLSLIEELSPSFSASFTQLQEYNGRKEPLSTFQMGNSMPSAPWVVPPRSSSACAHVPDITRTQETFLLGGAENTDSLRDWNEEIQTARELPKDTVQDRVFRERLLAKIFAEYTDAAVTGAALVARGEVAPMNPTECRDAQIFVYNNVFFSFGADGVGTFASEGGDEAARIATGKDVVGVKLVNQLDIDGLFTPGTVVVDYLGKRIVGQSIVPGIFKQPEPGENQIHYGAVDGKDTVSADDRFVPTFEKLAQTFHVKKHSVWDKDGKKFELEASVEMKGLLGSDARKYVLDLYRITPLDIAWMEEAAPVDGAEYPHRMTVLRHELVESLYRQKAREYMNAELAKHSLRKNSSKESEPNGEEKAADEGDEKVESSDTTTKTDKTEGQGDEQDKIDLSGFTYALNADVFSGQVPQTQEEKEQMAIDEQEVRDACVYLSNVAIPSLLNDLKESDISFPMDGRSLGRLLHRRGINLRYLGKIASLSEEDSRLQCLRELCVREIIARSFKHVAARYLKDLPLPLTSACFSHLLNCLLGFGLNPKPTAEVDENLRGLYTDVELSFEKATPESIRESVGAEAARRYRFVLQEGWWNSFQRLQLLREICLKLGLQLQAKNYVFAAETDTAAETKPVVNGQANGEGKKKRRKARDASPASIASHGALVQTFSPEDILNVVPVVKDSAPRSNLAEEALEAGRVSLNNGQKKLGQELLFESLSLHEQIYGLLHPETAQVYHALSQTYYQLDEKDIAVELARKACIASERTMGIDSSETVLDYLNLSLFLHQVGDSKTALVHAKHALAVWKVMYGSDHPDTITTLNNGAVMLQSLKAYHESRRWFEHALRICEGAFGKQSVNCATLLFQLAQALALDNDSKAAVSRMRESYTIFLAALGPEDKNTKEAENWLEQLTQNAVSIAKQEKDKAARRLRAGIRFIPINTGMGASPMASAPGVAGSGRGTSIDSRSIDEIIKFIEGSDKPKKNGNSAKKGPSRGNPKRRGGGPISTTA
ncbi:hypothetical protein P8C59_000371 [Phyllachora maydis]|uniref:Clustered mitochondria protein homolog n=1 Tax=Phyllachora maydis TaxID=1825666 RepID=A0AAD9HW53_9PEZI|nr:hypothetical protein P8C59_000371 [Phyllachora maydis]